ncbi:MAG: alpha/beta hydrolase [Gemmatimonadota bacterium]
MLTPPQAGPNTPPVVSVSGNVLEGEVTYGASLSLSATCVDREDGARHDVQWSTDGGLLLGEGTTLRFLPEPGRYLILATCRDAARVATTVAATPPFTVVDRWSARDSIPITVTLPFATNRGGRMQPRAPGSSFDGSPRDSLVRGFLTVNVPSGDFRAAGSAQRTPFMRSVRGNVVSADKSRLWLRDIRTADSTQFASALTSAFSLGDEDDVLVFVHGYRTSFEGSVVRAARLAAEIQFEGATILFAWPSDALLASYRSDQRDARDAGRYLAALLRELQSAPHPRRLSIVAHSMGAEVLASGLLALESDGPRNGAADRPHLSLRDVVLVAPDLAASDFVQRVLPALRDRAERVTLYASSADIALWSSWGSNLERRLGLGGRFATVARGIETVEVPYSATDAIGHNPFAAEPFRDDLHRLLVTHLSADRRDLTAVARDDGLTMWRLP